MHDRVTIDAARGERWLFEPLSNRSGQQVREFGHIRYHDVGFVPRPAERAITPVDERSAHAEGLRADTIESVTGNMHDLKAIYA